MKIRVGLVGLGQAWEKRHRPALRALGDRFEVRAICEEVALRAQHAARDFGAAQVDGFRALAQRDDIDAILMLTPQWFGPLPILAACDAGKAVYCAAAMDLEPDRAREIKDRVEEAGIAFMAEFPRRHAPATLRLKELIATRLGAPRLIFCHRRMTVSSTNGIPVRSRWQSHPVVRDLTELVDWCRYIVGSEPTSVFGVCHRRCAESPESDYEMMSLDFSGPAGPGTGPLAHISCGHYMPTEWREATSYRPPAGVQVACEHGVAFVDLPTTVVWFDEAGRHQESLESERPVGEQLLSQFYRAVTSLVRKTSDLEDAYRALQVVTTARKCYEEGRRLSVEY
ncbi:MAG: Gfo/Idh/MocA family oxidoreductase [Pirellulaceae bacterium]|nr:Gfo/Idh/MocA family oxidoreductase [Planctomycetales bacterium]MCA9264863.1 Gfo/Idh/MocA family oxidoreductase [Planctomycetales bacterium]